MTQPKTAAEYLDRGCDKDDQKDSKGAIEDYSKAIGLNPNYVEAYANRGCAKEELGDKEGAIADWQKAADLGDQEAAKWIKEIQAKNTKKGSSLTKKEEPVKGQKLAECIVDLLEDGCHDPEEVALVLGYSSLDEKGNVQPSVDALMKAIKDAGVDIENEESSEIDKFGIWDGKLCQALDSHGMKIWIPKRLYDKYPHAYEHAGPFEEVADWEDMNFPEPMMEGDLTIMKWIDRNLEFVDAFSGDDLALFNDLDPKDIHDMVGYG